MKEQLCGYVISCKNKFGEKQYIKGVFPNKLYVQFRDTINLAKLFNTPDEAEEYFNTCIEEDKILTNEYDVDTFSIEEVTYKTYEYKKL